MLQEASQASSTKGSQGFVAIERLEDVRHCADAAVTELSGYLAGLGYSGGASASLTVHGPVPAGTVSDLQALLR